MWQASWVIAGCWLTYIIRKWLSWTFRLITTWSGPYFPQFWRFIPDLGVVNVLFSASLEIIHYNPRKCEINVEAKQVLIEITHKTLVSWMQNSADKFAHQIENKFSLFQIPSHSILCKLYKREFGARRLTRERRTKFNERYCHEFLRNNLYRIFTYLVSNLRLLFPSY